MQDWLAGHRDCCVRLVTSLQVCTWLYVTLFKKQHYILFVYTFFNATTNVSFGDIVSGATDGGFGSCLYVVC